MRVLVSLIVLTALTLSQAANTYAQTSLDSLKATAKSDPDSLTDRHSNSEQETQKAAVKVDDEEAKERRDTRWGIVALLAIVLFMGVNLAIGSIKM